MKEIKKYSCVYKPDKSNIQGLSLLPPVKFYIFNNNKKISHRFTEFIVEGVLRATLPEQPNLKEVFYPRQGDNSRSLDLADLTPTLEHTNHFS